MKESANIANRFSDAYMVALLEGGNVDEVISTYETNYPELNDIFRREAKGLELLYGHIRKSELPSDPEIARAYATVTSRMSPAVVTSKAASPSFAFRIRRSVSSFFSGRPVMAGASLALVAAVLLAILYFPQPQDQTVPVAANDKQVTTPSAQDQGSPQIAEAQKQSKAPEEMSAPTFRGSRAMGTQDKGQLDKKDRERLTRLMTDNTLVAPTGLKVVALTSDSIVLRWNPVKNALSYIVEIKRANEGQFTAVSQTSQTQARLFDLPSSERIEIRVVAASGERKGEASAAKIVSVP